MKNEYTRELPLPNCPPKIPKKNAWIVWTVSNEGTGRIKDLQVYELSEYEFQKEKTLEYVNMRTKENKIIYFDIGCICSDWNEHELKDVLLRLCVRDGFQNQKTMIACMKNLATIEEFQKDIEKWFR
jgi:hypothetical protein